MAQFVTPATLELEGSKFSLYERVIASHTMMGLKGLKINVAILRQLNVYCTLYDLKYV